MQQISNLTFHYITLHHIDNTTFLLPQINYLALHFSFFAIKSLQTGDVPDCTFNVTAEPDLERCPEENALVIILFAVYMIMTNVLLLNLLIAMFR